MLPIDDRACADRMPTQSIRRQTNVWMQHDSAERSAHRHGLGGHRRSARCTQLPTSAGLPGRPFGTLHLVAIQNIILRQSDMTERKDMLRAQHVGARSGVPGTGKRNTRDGMTDVPSTGRFTHSTAPESCASWMYMWRRWGSGRKPTSIRRVRAFNLRTRHTRASQDRPILIGSILRCPTPTLKIATTTSSIMIYGASSSATRRY